MLSEYAVEPAAMGADWGTFKDLIDRFGADKGRLISRLPKKWEKKVIQAAKNASVSDVRMKSIIERLRGAKHKVIDHNRAYDPETLWIDNALQEHGKRPFRAIICNDGSKPCAGALVPDDCSDDHPLFSTPISRNVARTRYDIANALLPLAKVAQEIDIVDPYFDLRPGKGYIGPLESLLKELSLVAATPKVIKVHFRSHDSRPTSEMLAQDATAQTKGMLPPGYRLELYEWLEIQGGEDLHDRFFLTEFGGLMCGAGFSEQGPAETAVFTLLDLNHVQQLRGRFSANSTVYTRIGLVVRINADGRTELL